MFTSLAKVATNLTIIIPENKNATEINEALKFYKLIQLSNEDDSPPLKLSVEKKSQTIILKGDERSLKKSIALLADQKLISSEIKNDLMSQFTPSPPATHSPTPLR